MRKSNVTICILIGVFIAFCIINTFKTVKPKGFANNDRVQVKDNEREVINQTLESVYGCNEIRESIIERNTSLNTEVLGELRQVISYVESEMKATGIHHSVVQDFQRKNVSVASLDSCGTEGCNCRFIEPSQLDDLARSVNFWESLYKGFNVRNLITLSQVGFSNDMKQAIVYSGKSCGYKCGKGYFVLLQEENLRWQVVKKVEVWTS
jgi:hypothetical protein